MSSELGAGRDPLWPVLGTFSIAGWNREVRSKAASFLGLICSDCVPTGARTWAFHRRCFRRAGLRSGSPGALRSPGDGATWTGGRAPGPACAPGTGPGRALRAAAPGEGPLTWEGAAFHSLGAARILARASSPSRPWSSCGLRHAPTRRRRWAAEKGVGGTHWPGIWHRTWLVNAWRPPEHQPVPNKHLASRQFHQKLFSLFPTPLGNLFCATRNGPDGEAIVGPEPRLLASSSSSSKEAHLNCVSNITTPRKGDLGGRASPRGAWTASPEQAGFAPAAPGEAARAWRWRTLTSAP